MTPAECSDHSRKVYQAIRNWSTGRETHSSVWHPQYLNGLQALAWEDAGNAVRVAFFSHWNDYEPVEFTMQTNRAACQALAEFLLRVEER